MILSLYFEKTYLGKSSSVNSKAKSRDFNGIVNIAKESFDFEVIYDYWSVYDLCKLEILFLLFKISLS